MRRHPHAVRLHPTDMERLGARLRELRKSRKLSQVHVAAALGCDDSIVCLIEKGRATVSIAQLVAFAHLIGRHPGGLITELLHSLSLSQYRPGVENAPTPDSGEAA